MASVEPPKSRSWAPRFWEGCDYFSWLRLFLSNRCAVEPPYWYIASVLACTTFVNTVLRWVQHHGFHERIRQTTLVGEPIFVLGHWRTGTTLLHELLIRDQRFTSPTTLQCFEPCHFLVTGHLFQTYGQFLLPDKRPMDNMAAGWDRPQEDEFALALLGQPSTYTDFAFPKRKPLAPGALDLSGLNRVQTLRWQKALLHFLKAVTLADPRRLVLKSPPHTARLRHLLQLFPQAKFVHLVRHPYTLFASTVNLWMSLAKSHGLQTPVQNADLEAKVYREFRIIHERYEADKVLIPQGNLIELRYEDVVQDIPGHMELIYDRLALDEYDAARPAVLEYVQSQRGYTTNRYQLDATTKAAITHHWGDIIAAQGYSTE
jgi:hypothetical protein